MEYVKCLFSGIIYQAAPTFIILYRKRRVWDDQIRASAPITNFIQREAKCEGDYSPPSTAKVNNAWRYTSNPPHAFMALVL
jgi:hypothetical protein